MMLAQALTTMTLGRHWNFDPHKNSPSEWMRHRAILRLFADCPDPVLAPLSIHRLSDIANKNLNKCTGDWFGPSSIAIVMCDALNQAQKAGYGNDAGLDSLGLYVGHDGSVFWKDVEELAKKFPFVALIVPMRLGMLEFDTAYESVLKAFLASRFSLGAIGGKPRHSLYFTRVGI